MERQARGVAQGEYPNSSVGFYLILGSLSKLSIFKHTLNIIFT